MWFSCFDLWCVIRGYCCVLTAKISCFINPWTVKDRFSSLFNSAQTSLCSENFASKFGVFCFQINWSIKCSFMDWDYSSEAHKILYKNPLWHKYLWYFLETCIYRTTTINPKTFWLQRSNKPLKNPFNHLKNVFSQSLNTNAFVTSWHFCETWFLQNSEDSCADPTSSICWPNKMLHNTIRIPQNHIF